MKDFTKPAPSAEQQRSDLIKRLVLLQVFGAPLFLGLAVSAMAYFGGAALVPILEDQQTALTVLVVCIVGLLIEGLFTVKTVLALGALGKQR